MTEPRRPQVPPDVEPAALTALAARLATEAGRMVRAGRAAAGGGADGMAVTSKSTATDMVTEFDTASERLIVAGVRAQRPDDGIVGEEGTSTTGTTGVSWLIDPIDGTTNFLYGLAGYAVSIAATGPHGTLAAAVYLPATDELFTATIDGGAFLNGSRIRCSATTTLAAALVGTGFSYQPARRTAQAQRVAALIADVRDIRRLGAAAADLCYVACGRLDAYFEEHLGPWDLAAGELIAREAGCRTGALDGGPVHPGSVLAAPPALFEPLRARLARADDELANR